MAAKDRKSVSFLTLEQYIQSEPINIHRCHFVHLLKYSRLQVTTLVVEQMRLTFSGNMGNICFQMPSTLISLRHLDHVFHEFHLDVVTLIFFLEKLVLSAKVFRFSDFVYTSGYTLLDHPRLGSNVKLHMSRTQCR